MSNSCIYLTLQTDSDSLLLLECTYVIIFFTIVFKTDVVYIETLCHTLVPHLLILIGGFNES